METAPPEVGSGAEAWARAGSVVVGLVSTSGRFVSPDEGVCRGGRAAQNGAWPRGAYEFIRGNYLPAELRRKVNSLPTDVK